VVTTDVAAGEEERRHRWELSRRELFERDLTHELVAQYLAKFDTLGRRGALLIGCSLDFPGNRVELSARVIERRHVLLFDHEQDVEIMRCRGVAKENLVIQDKV